MEKFPATLPQRRREQAAWLMSAVRLACGWIFAVGLAFASSCWAHFLLNVNIRVIHIDANDGAVNVYIRIPMPLVVAGFYDARGADPTNQAVPFTRPRLEDGVVMHYVDIEQVKAKSVELGRLVAEGHHLLSGGHELNAEVVAVRLHSARNQTRFATLGEAKAALDGPVITEGDSLAYVGNTVVDVALRYAASNKSRLALKSSFAPKIKDIEKLANLILYHVDGQTYVYRISGVLGEPVTLYASWWDAATSFVGHGVEHILEGVDHVLFVVCLTIGAASLVGLFWRVTGFTIGHSATLATGFFGIAPAGAWFIPSVELAIAVSIIYAGTVALLRRPGAATFFVTAAIGLIHGFGFSFVLREVLRVGSPYIGTSLVSFNIGVELGQLAIVVAVWIMLYLVRQASLDAARYAHTAVAGGCTAVATYWTVQRAVALVQYATI